MGWFDQLRKLRIPSPYAPTLEDTVSSLGEQTAPIRKKLYETFVENPTAVQAGHTIEEETASRDPSRPLELGDVPAVALGAIPSMLTGRTGILTDPTQRAYARGFGEQAAAETVKNITPGDVAVGGLSMGGRVAAKVGLRAAVPLIEKAGHALSAVGDVSAIGAGSAQAVEGLKEGDPMQAATGTLMATMGAAGRLGAHAEHGSVVEPHPPLDTGFKTGQGEVVPPRPHSVPRVVPQDRLGIGRTTAEALPANVVAGGRSHAKAAEFLKGTPEWNEFSDWYREALDLSKKTILGLPGDVLPPDTHMGGVAQSVANTPFLGANFTPGRYASNQLRFRDPNAVRKIPYSEGIAINPMPHMRDLAEDAIQFPHYADILADPQKRAEELLRRFIHAGTHELIHSAGVRHPAWEHSWRGGRTPGFEGKNDVVNQLSHDYTNKFLNDPSANQILGPTGDVRFGKMMRAALKNYEAGAFDGIMEKARPHAKRWFDTFDRAYEITGGRETPTGAVPPRRIKVTGATPGGPPGSGGAGVGAGGLSGGTGPAGGGPTVAGGGPGGVAPPPIPPPTPPIPPEGFGKKDYKKLPGHTIQDFINKRSAAFIHGRQARFDFKDLLDKDMDWIRKFEEEGPQSVPGGDRVKALFDSLRAEEIRYGVPVKERPNYIYHIWEQSPDEVRRAFRRLGVRPGFTQERIFDTYEMGKKAGLTPKYTNPTDIIAERVRQHKKLIADVGLYNTLRANKFIKPINKAPKGWVEVRNFPFHRYTTGKYEHIQPWAAPLEIAQKLNRYLDSPISSPIRDFWQKAAAISTDIKNVVMSSGIPGTRFNMHGFNVARRIAATRDTTMGSLMKAVEMPFRLLETGKKEAKWVEGHLKDAARFTEAGMRFDIEDHPFRIVEGQTVPREKQGFWQSVREARDQRKSTISKAYGGLRKMHELLFEDPLFQKSLPAWKLQFAIEEEKRLLAHGIEPKEATKVAAHNANNIFGGINWVEEGRDPQFQTFLRLALNAPDWAETNLRIGKGAIKGIFNPRDPRFKVYRNVVRNAAVYYLLTNAITRIFSKGEYPAERHFQIRAGKSAAGRTRFLKGAGTAEDWVRLPYEVTAKLAKGDLSGVSDVVRARLHPMTQGLLNVVTNRNYWGRPLTGEKIPVLSQIGRMAKEVTDVAAPAYVAAPVAALAGQAGPEEAIVKAVEAPIAYARPDTGTGGGHRRLFSRYTRPLRKSR